MQRFDLSDLGPQAFPLTIRAFKAGTDEQVWTTTVRRPGSVDLPALGPVWIRYEYADGDVVEFGKSRIVRWLSKPLIFFAKRRVR